MRIILIALLSLFLGSCATQKMCERKYPGTTTTKDSLVVTYKDSTIIKDSVAIITKDSIVYTAAVKDSGELSTSEDGTYKFKNENVAIKIVVKDNKVKYFVDISAIESRFSYKIKSLTSELQSYKSKDSISTHSQVIVKPAPIIKDKWYVKIWEQFKNWLAIIGACFLLYHAGRIGLRKLFLKIG